MHFDLIQALSLAGKPSVPNDDRLGCADTHAWVIDGATDLGAPGLLGARGGAAWLASAAQRAFNQFSGPLPQLCEQVFRSLEQAYQHAKQREPVAAWELPRASFAAVALEGEQLVCAFMSDCVVLQRSAAGVAFLTPAPDRATEMAEAAALGPGAGAGILRSPEVLADRRAARERPKAVLSVDAAQATAGTRYVRAAVAPGDELILMSDGFAALFDTYQVYSPDAFFAAVLAEGLGPLAQQLRAIEVEDAACVRYPRFKASDDASALWLRVA